MESVFIVFWIILLVTQVRKTDSAIDDIMYEAEEESKKFVTAHLTLDLTTVDKSGNKYPDEDKSVNEDPDDIFTYKVDGREKKFTKFQYDMLLLKEQYKKLMDTDLSLPPHRSRRNAIKDQDSLWPFGRIPYTIDDYFSDAEEISIRNAIDMWSRWTCLTFFKAMNNEYNKLNFELKHTVCGESEVGMAHGKQYISLSRKCATNVRVVAHEIGHAIGLFHEQMRHDRDEYVTVFKDNLMHPFRNQFDVMKQDEYQDFFKPYDYLSIMHYGKLFFSKNRTSNLVTLSPKNESYLDIIGEVQTISYYDVKIVCQLYNCSARCNSMCSGGSFMGAECQCLCRGPSDDNPIKYCEVCLRPTPCANPTGWSPKTMTKENRFTEDLDSTINYSSDSCSMLTVDYSQYVVLDKYKYESIPKHSGPFSHGTAIEVAWEDTATCGEDGSTYTCQNGEWIGELPECHPGCVLRKKWRTQYTIYDDYTPNTVSGGSDNNDDYISDSYQHKDNITLSCVSNLTKMVTSQCKNGSWTTFIVNCPEVVLNCPAIKGFPGRVKFRQQGAKVNFKCPSGFNIHGSRNLKCQRDGSWNGETPVCLYASVLNRTIHQLSNANGVIHGIHSVNETHLESDSQNSSCDLVITKDGRVIDDAGVALAFGDKENRVYCNLTCTGSGMPPTLRWYRQKKDGSTKQISKFNSKRIYSVRTTHNRSSILTISSMLDRDAGTYTCIGLIDNKVVEKSIYLRYTCENSTFMCDGTKCMQRYLYCNGVRDCRDGTDEKDCGRIRPKIDIYPKATQVISVGSSALFQCRDLSEYSLSTITWSRIGEETMSKKTELFVNGVIMFKQVTQADQGDYLCTANNDMGAINATVTLNVEAGSDIDKTSNVGKKTVNVGDRVFMECIVTGTPIPTITWTRDDGPLPRDVIIGDGMLIIPQAKIDDAGIYTCLAINTDGFIASKVFLYVNEWIE